MLLTNQTRKAMCKLSSLWISTARCPSYRLSGPEKDGGVAVLSRVGPKIDRSAKRDMIRQM